MIQTGVILRVLIVLLVPFLNMSLQPHALMQSQLHAPQGAAHLGLRGGVTNAKGGLMMGVHYGVIVVQVNCIG